MNISTANDQLSSVPSLSDLQKVLSDLAQLPQQWHGCGCLGPDVLSAIARHTAGKPVQYSMETGTGKSTVLLSHISKQHLCFAVNFGDSLETVKSSPLLRRESVSFVEGPTQSTLPTYSFTSKLQLALIDGPHGFPFPQLEYYFLYPQLAPGALLIIDDIGVPTIYQLFDFVRHDQMFEFLEIVEETAFLRRTDAPTFDPFGDGWWLQEYNRKEGKTYSQLAQARRDTGNQVDARVGAMNAEIERLQTKVDRITASLSFRLGMLMTAPARKLREVLQQRG